MVDSQFSKPACVTAVSHSCMFQLRLLTSVGHSLSMDTVKTPVSAFISSRLNYSNRLFVVVWRQNCSPFRMQQHNSSRSPESSTISRPYFVKLHWLPVRRRVDFKVATLVHKCLDGLAPTYVTDDCIPVSSLSGQHHLRPADMHKLFVPRTFINYGVAIFCRFWTQRVEQSPNRIANDWEFWCFSLETENTLVMSVKAAKHICGSELIYLLYLFKS